MTETRGHYGLPDGDIWTWTDADQQLLEDAPIGQLRGLYKLARLSMFDLYKERDLAVAESRRYREALERLMDPLMPQSVIEIAREALSENTEDA